jgi:hypothetical protein
MSIFFVAPIDQHPDFNKVITTPTANTEDPLYPASNLLTYDPTQVFSSNGGAQNPQITWDFGSTRSFDIVSLLHTNLGELSTIYVEGSANGTSWTVIFNGLTIGQGLAHYLPAQDPKPNMLRKNATLAQRLSGRQDGLS